MTRKANTTTIQGGAEYARVPERLKLFREDCPKGVIETEQKINEDGSVMFKATVFKDGTDRTVGSATGHSLGNTKGIKAFEKQETIAVGRALALLGYLASGEIASSEEMNEYFEYREGKIDEIVATIATHDSLESLKAYFMSLGPMMAEKRIIDAKDKRKNELIKPKETKNADTKS